MKYQIVEKREENLIIQILGRFFLRTVLFRNMQRIKRRGPPTIRHIHTFHLTVLITFDSI